MQITIEVDDRIYKLALEWNDYLKANPLPERNDPEWDKAYGIITEAWKEFLTKHKLIRYKKPRRIFGIKTEDWCVPAIKEFNKALDLIRYSEEAKEV